MNLFGITLPMTVEQLRRAQQAALEQLRDAGSSLPDPHGDWEVRVKDALDDRSDVRVDINGTYTPLELLALSFTLAEYALQQGDLVEMLREWCEKTGSPWPPSFLKLEVPS